MKILLVEDEFIVATALKILLEIMGHEVVGIADDVVSAVHQSQSTHPQLAFFDMQLANGASGLDAAAELQKSGVLCIFFTGNPPGGPRPDLALGCLPKPCTDKALAGAIKIAEAVIEGLPLPPTPLGLELYRR
ncbi:response regulator [Sphingomonas sp. HMP6]|uniref:response regulator n=1 Tax=Sphingomonas sp. HMP6 TaxID=1517551 RepID=UPI00159672A1|nr:response regulator [Sphingomonas sp. HMP6]